MLPLQDSPAVPQPNFVTTLWRTMLHFDATKFAPWLALRNSAGVALPLIVGVAFHQLPTGIAIASGALNVAFSDSHEPYIVRARRMLAASVLVGAAVSIGAWSGSYGALAVAVAGCWAFIAGILVALSGPAADLGILSLVTLVVYSAVPHQPLQAVEAGALAFAGGLLQTALSLALWRLRRYTAQRRALSGLYAELAKLAHTPIQATDAPPASAQTTEARRILASLDRDRSVDGERYRLLLSQAERMRLSLLMLLRIRARLRRDTRETAAPDLLERFLTVASRMMETIAHQLAIGEPVTEDPGHLGSLHGFAEEMRVACQSVEAPSAGALIRDGRFQMDALAGQLRAAIDLAAYANPAGEAAFARRETHKPWTLRLAGTIATLRANLNLESAAFRHAIRLAVCVAAGDALGRSFGLSRSYWLPMTIAIVLKPDFTATFSRGFLRLLGTFVGLAFATGLVHIPSGPMAHAVAVGALMFLMRCFGPANYGVFVACVTALVVVLFALAGVAPKDVMGARALNTAAGGLIALAAYALWPTWERKQVPELVARMLDAYREYFRVIRQAHIEPGVSFANELDAKRMAARLARSNLEASLERLAAEPGTEPAALRAFSAMLAASHRMVQATMALEAGLSTSRPAAARPAFRTFADHVELTLYFLAAALRGSPLTVDELPDLREDHHALVQSGDSLTERYALVNVETDRITNSLNTLSEELLGLTGRSRLRVARR